MCRAGGVNVGSRMRADDYRPLQGAKKRLSVPESLATVCDGITPPTATPRSLVRPAKATLNKSPRWRAPWFGMGCKAQATAMAVAIARICNAADRPKQGCAVREGLVQRCPNARGRAPRLRAPEPRGPAGRNPPCPGCPGGCDSADSGRGRCRSPSTRDSLRRGRPRGLNSPRRG